MKLVVIESPYAGKPETWDADVAANMAYLDRCIRDCVFRGEAPYASHKMMTTALDDRVPVQRRLGIDCGLAFRRRVDLRVFYVDRGWSSGMLAARDLYDAEGLPYEIRSVETHSHD